MIIGILTSLFNDQGLDSTLRYLKGVGFDAVELYTGALIKPNHCDVETLLNSNIALDKFKDTIKRYNMIISGLNCSGNQISPIPGVAKLHNEKFEKTVLLAEKLGIDRIITFSGCPGGGPKDETPNWVTCPWPEEFLSMLEYQWNEVLIPYWENISKFALDHGVDKICLEMHPGFCVYNPETLRKLRDAVGSVIGANFDPSHLFWQGIDPAQAILELDEAIYHMHAKDTRLYRRNVEINGVLDAKHYNNIKNRSWVFGTVGYGHSEQIWKSIIDSLGIIGYDYVVSIEHEDSLKAKKEGLEKAYGFLKNIIVKEKPGEMWWA